MISNQKKIAILETILASEEFNTSIKSQSLLRYLVEASLNNRKLNETTIAKEFFCKDSNFYPLDDASVRVSISQLRKKVEHYYLSEGRNEKTRIDFPKGHYTVRFSNRNQRDIGIYINRAKKIFFPFLTLLLSIIIIYLWIQNDGLRKRIEIIPEDNPIWAEYLLDAKPTLVVLGDFFFMYYERSDGKPPRINVRDPLINSLTEFQDHFEANPNKENTLKPLVHTYLRPNSVWGLIEVLPILKSSKSSFFIKQASEIVWEDINSHNILFIGQFKTMYILKAFLQKVNARYSIYPNLLYFYNKNGEEIHRFEAEMDFYSRQYNDYSLVAKFSGPNNNTIMLLMGFNEGSVVQAVKTITDPDFPKKIQKDYSNLMKKPLHFKMVLGVTGYRRSDLSSKIAYFDSID